MACNWRGTEYEQLPVQMIRKDTLRVQEDLVKQAKQTKQDNEEADAARAERVSNWDFDANSESEDDDSDSEDDDSSMDVDETPANNQPMPAANQAEPVQLGAPSQYDPNSPAASLVVVPPNVPDVVTRAFSTTPPPDSTQLTGHVVLPSQEEVEEELAAVADQTPAAVPAPPVNPRRSTRSSSN